MPEDHGSVPAPSHSKACHIHSAVQTITFSLYSSSKAKMKNGSYARAGEKLIALNQMEKVVDCLGLCRVYLWKETGADPFENITRQKINFLLIKCFGRNLLSECFSLLLLLMWCFVSEALALALLCPCPLGLEFWPTSGNVRAALQSQSFTENPQGFVCAFTSAGG